MAKGKILTLLMDDKDAQDILFGRGTEKERYKMFMRARLISMVEQK